MNPELTPSLTPTPEQSVVLQPAEVPQSERKAVSWEAAIKPDSENQPPVAQPPVEQVTAAVHEPVELSENISQGVGTTSGVSTEPTAFSQVTEVALQAPTDQNLTALARSLTNNGQ